MNDNQTNNFGEQNSVETTENSTETGSNEHETGHPAPSEPSNSPPSTDNPSSAQSAPVTNPNPSKLTTNIYLIICAVFILLSFAKTFYVAHYAESDFLFTPNRTFQLFCALVTLTIGICTIIQAIKLESAQKVLDKISKHDLAILQLFDSLIVSIGCASLTTCAIIEQFVNIYVFINSLEYFYLLYVPCLVVSLAKRHSFNKFYKANKQTKDSIDDQISPNIDSKDITKSLKLFYIIKWIIIAIVTGLTIFGICYLIMAFRYWLNHPII